jgi:methylmalonyl-CoA mutase N-terminal domain/subunit
VDAALAKLAGEAADPERNLMPALIEAVSTYATLGEVMSTLGDVFGRHVEVPTI